MTNEVRSLGCARCGDCCENIYFSMSMDDLGKWTTAYLVDVPDPSTDEGWAWWVSEERGTAAWRDTTLSRGMAIDYYNPRGERRLNADFITAHWRETSRDEDGTPRHTCDQFNAETRLCEARDDRPPVCRDYPWYGRGPRRDVIRVNLHCSYLLDLPPVDRPEGARPLIPIEVIKR